MDNPSNYISRKLYDRDITALTDRCIAAETCVVDLLNLIDADLLKRHDCDWLAAVREITA